MRQIVAATAPTQSLPTAAVGLDRLPASIALHPDPLPTRMRLRAHNPPTAGRLDDRLTGHAAVKGQEPQDAATRKGPGPIFVALACSPRW